MPFNNEMLRTLRNKLEITQKELANLLCIDSDSAISMWETGDSMPKTDKLPKLAKILGCSIDELFTEYCEVPEHDED